jgi:hypothetical protein
MLCPYGRLVRLTWTVGQRGRLGDERLVLKKKEPALPKGLWVNPFGIHGTGPALRKATAQFGGRHKNARRGKPALRKAGMSQRNTEAEHKERAWAGPAKAAASRRTPYKFIADERATSWGQVASEQ